MKTPVTTGTGPMEHLCPLIRRARIARCGARPRSVVLPVGHRRSWWLPIPSRRLSFPTIRRQDRSTRRRTLSHHPVKGPIWPRAATTAGCSGGSTLPDRAAAHGSAPVAQVWPRRRSRGWRQRISQPVPSVDAHGRHRPQLTIHLRLRAHLRQNAPVQAGSSCLAAICRPNGNSKETGGTHYCAARFVVRLTADAPLGTVAPC